MELKKPYTLDEQIKKLKDHGVVISDDAFSRKVLQKVSYYRFSGYMLQYRLSTDSHEMIKGICFGDFIAGIRIYCGFRVITCNMCQTGPQRSCI